MTFEVGQEVLILPSLKAHSASRPYAGCRGNILNKNIINDDLAVGNRYTDWLKQ